MMLFQLLWGMFILQESTLAILQNGFAFKTSICEGKNGGLLPMLGTCKGYYVCADGKAVIGTCEKNTVFNPLTLHCDDPDKVDCIFDGQDNGSDETFSSESDEDDDEVIVRTEPPVTVKPTRKQRPSAQDIGLSDITNRICAGKKDGVMLAKKGSCQEYFVCKARKPYLRSCTDQQHFSPTRRICMKPSEAKCSAGLRETQSLDGPAITGGLCSDEKENSLVPHRKDCGKFMLCSNMMFLVMDCPAGLHFNAASSRCDYPKIAKCKTMRKETKSKSKPKKPVRKAKTHSL
ncbi:probable chitinase 10 [Drosophila eugracilis]|uniref:probable chitinase 10 n=1 Tax=Drosophila eugracilis TaxID=29029 RepID=UPI0007E66AC5|nr:probable chitinase 10 [Drosophila eugracilis]